MIPRVIHYCWFGGRPLPERAEACVRSWIARSLGYEIRRWDEREFDVANCRFSREAAERGDWAFVSDVARLRIIHDHGGIYFDTDVELLRPLDDLLGYEAFFGFQEDRTVNTGHGFGAVTGHPVVAALLASYENGGFLGPSGRPDRTPCPARDAAVFQRLGFRMDGARQERDGTLILPAECFSPKSFHSGRMAVTPRTYAIHHFNASWHAPLEAAHHARRRRYCRMLGERLGTAIYRFDCRARNLAVMCGLGSRWSKGDR